MDSLSVTPLKTEHVQAEYDREAKILRVTYIGELSPDVTNQFYAWLLPIIQQNPELLTEARGSIYDFRQVSDFKTGNMTTARKQSQNVNQQNMEIKRHPVALVVANLMQERTVSVMMVLTRQSERKKIVNSIEAGEKYITDWHTEEE